MYMPCQCRKAIFTTSLLLLFLAPLRGQQSPPETPVAPQAVPPTQAAPPTQDVKEIVSRALDMDQSGFRLARNYTFQQRQELKVLDKKGG